MAVFDKYRQKIGNLDTICTLGRVLSVQELLIESRGPAVQIGQSCDIIHNNKAVQAEVVQLQGNIVKLMPFSYIDGLGVNAEVIPRRKRLSIPVSQHLLGRVVNALGITIDDKPPIRATEVYPVMAHSLEALKRKPITEQIATGIRAIDALLAVGKGQRMGIFSATGVGKSTLLSMIAKNSSADVNVIALIGERGREVREFIERDLGEEGMKRSVIIVSTSDTAPAARAKAAYTATATAEYFRDQGKDVVLLFDSVTRFARAQREIGLSTGEIPATRGYPPSTFSTLPKLLERCGSSDKGSITGFYTILVEGDDIDEPISDNIRGILDGHIILSRNLAARGHYPPIDVVQSLSRLAVNITSSDHQLAARYMRSLLAIRRQNNDLISIGAYNQGTNPELDKAIELESQCNSFLQQEVQEKSTLEETLGLLSQITSMPITRNLMSNLQFAELPTQEQVDEGAIRA